MTGRRLSMWILVGIVFGIGNYAYLDDWEHLINQVFGLGRQTSTTYYWWDEFSQWIPLSIWAVPVIMIILLESWRLERPVYISLFLTSFFLVANATFYFMYAIDSFQQFGTDRIVTDVAPGLGFWTLISVVVGGIAGLAGGAVGGAIVRRLSRQGKDERVSA